MTTQRKTAKETRGTFHYAKFSRNFDPNLIGTVWLRWKFSTQRCPPPLIGQNIEQNHIPANHYARLSLVHVKESCTYTLGSSILNLPPHPYMDGAHSYVTTWPFAGKSFDKSFLPALIFLVAWDQALKTFPNLQSTTWFTLLDDLFYFVFPVSCLFPPLQSQVPD